MGRMKRRDILKGGLAASTLFMPLPHAWVWAQTEGSVKLLALPKIALVLGNSKYKDAPLRNPANDAAAFGAALKEVGFDVSLKLDAGKADMVSAVQAYVQAIAAKKCVGLFYYAGHGIQLAWRNYMLPVDADVDTIADIQKQGVEVNALLEGLAKAANPLNLVILDACRDNPFGNLKGVDHKGLSQMDAPNNSVLAFATAPGNVASDGDGANGLYTENFLREMKVPEAKLEDVFKRVRLNVRRRSNGAQVPWESTSLEEDFWFLPPRELKRQSEAQKAAEFKEEVAAWERVRDSANADDIYAYLLKFPTGFVAEQAQFRLDQLQKPKIEAAAGANGVKPLASGTNRYALGDEFAFDVVDLFTKAARRVVVRVTKADDKRVEFNDGETVVDQMGAVLKNVFGTKNPGIVASPAEISTGKRWRTAFTNTNASGVSNNFYDAHVVALEDVTVPAGTFKAFKIENTGLAVGPGGRTYLSVTRWVDPATMVSVRTDTEFKQANNQRSEYSSTRLVSMKRAPR
jgi:uncharacterized caspase-like protein